MELKDLVKIKFSADGLAYELDAMVFPKGNGKGELMVRVSDAEIVAQVYSLTAAAGLQVSTGMIQAALYQDDDAHDTCSLTACLNPLHPGPCKGWKGTLHSVSPGAWKALEAARVEKANANRIKKIEALKAQGKPIPHKLLQPILPKAQPNVGQTANKVTGEAHTAGQAVTDAAGVHVQTPGKMTLSEAAKPKLPVEKGPKGKKPTLASKGIAFIIAQEKVTPQYKLDKAAAITPEQWAGLSEADQSSIRGELSKIKNDGFGPQQTKADELLAKLTIEKPDPVAKAQAANAAFQKEQAALAKQAPIGKVTLGQAAKPKVGPAHKAEAEKAISEVLEKAKAEPPKITEMSEPNDPTSAGQSVATKAITEAIFGPQKTPMDAMVAAFDKMKASGKPVQDHLGFKAIVNKLAQGALKKATEDKMPGLGHGDNDAHIGTFNKQIADHIAEGKPGLPPLVAKMAAHHEAIKPENVKKGIEKAAQDAAAAKVVAKHEASPPKVTKLSEAVTPKPPAAHVAHAIAMANGTAPGASWAKNQLAAYQELSTAEFNDLPQATQGKIVADLKKGAGKFLDPKKVTATNKLLEKFGQKETKPEAPATGVDKPGISFTQGLKDPDLSEKQAKEMAANAPAKGLFLAAKDSAGLTEQDNPSNGEHAMFASDVADALVKVKTQLYDHSVKSQAEVIAAIDKLHTAATKQSYATNVGDAKKSAFNKIGMKLAVSSSDLTPLQKASLVEFQKYLLAHNNPDTSTAAIDKLKAETKAAENELTEKLQAALKKANAPKPEGMSNAQITDRTKELLGDLAVNPKTNLSLAELQYAKNMGEKAAAKYASKYPQEILDDPDVAAKIHALASVNGQANAAQAEINHLESHIKNFHWDATGGSGVDKVGNKLTGADKIVIAKHASLLKANNKHLYDTLEHNQGKVPVAQAALDAAAAKAEVKQATPKGPLSDYDKGTVEDAYTKAWGTHASKAVLYGAKGWADKEKMKAHSQYPAFTQDLGNLKALAGKVAVATAEAHTAKLNVPTDPFSGGMEAGPEYKAWLAKVAHRSDLEKQFALQHKTAQTRLDTIRTAAGLKKRALPKVDSPAVKTAAAEGAYYKVATYGGPLYGKGASAKQYLVAKVGPDLAVAHKTPSEKKSEKVAKVATSLPPMPAPKVHAKPPSTEAGVAPNATSAEMHGYHFTPKVAETNQYGWVPAESGAYVSSPEHLAELRKHLDNPDTKGGVAAQKEFKWSIGNMVGKGAATSGKNALYSYTGSSYGSINTKLNSLPPGTKQTGSSQISSIDAAFKASPPLADDVVLYRGFSDPQGVFKSGKWNDVNVAGMEWSQRSYSSTSGSLSTAQGFAGYSGVVMRIIIPKEMAVKGINAKGGQHPGENEVILQRGLRYRVVADYGKQGNQRYIDVMVVPNPYDKSE